MNIRFKPGYVAILIDDRIYGEVSEEREIYKFHFHINALHLTADQHAELLKRTTEYVSLLNTTERLLK